MRQISLNDVIPGMTLARHLLNKKGQVLLASGVTLTEEYLDKLRALDVNALFIRDNRYADIKIPEYLSLETQQRALAILSTTMEKVNRGENFAMDPICSLASDIVEELILQPSVAIQLTGIATHDDYTLAHSLNCAIYTALLARFCNFSILQIKEITCGALLHDLGKIEVDKEIINKPDRLTEQEFGIIKQHPESGFHLLVNKRWEISSLVAHMAWQHHEKVDGTGYPRGLQGEEILNYARLLTITDVYEAITGHRPYRKAMEPDEAYNIIASGLGTSFDETYGRVFLSKIATYMPGMEVLLNTGDLAVVVSIPGSSPQRPVIRLISYPDGSPYMPTRDLRLADNPQILISKIQNRKE
ncbi:HD-GYP domain-containing protein [Pelosinus sp. UFO1]|uniref:HD-GYP domain-containing protein n=1 Tax=Pelosinus sp. UFO1 TaxID=484770 RepID=UPI0004D0B2FC|nr:HD-GYP domain-containing protein [Pelosinus sp. UFO1]AIF50558.1 metal dependent phosphohydrolase [Pelosinus sp. UFO1]